MHRQSSTEQCTGRSGPARTHRPPYGDLNIRAVVYSRLSAISSLHNPELNVPGGETERLSKELHI